jgi:hypothetical protein
MLTAMNGLADINGDGWINAFDIDPLVLLLTSSTSQWA